MDVFGLYLDGIALRVRSAGKVTSVPGARRGRHSHRRAESSSWRWSSAAPSRSGASPIVVQLIGVNLFLIFLLVLFQHRGCLKI